MVNGQKAMDGTFISRMYRVTYTFRSAKREAVTVWVGESVGGP